MTYRVVKPLVLAQDQSGATHHVYQGGIIQWLSDAQAEHFLAEGLVVDLDADADGDGAAVAEGEKPARNSLKPTLVDWLVNNAVKEDGSDYTEDELGDKNKADLWALIDATED